MLQTNGNCSISLGINYLGGGTQNLLICTVKYNMDEENQHDVGREDMYKTEFNINQSMSYRDMLKASPSAITMP